MAGCRFCGCSSWLFGLTPGGLCANCEHLVSAEVEQRIRVLNESARGAETTQNASTKLDRLDLVVVQLEALAAHERRGIPIGLSAERQLREAARERDALLMQTAKRDLDDTMRAVRAEPDPERKAKLLLDFRLRLRDFAGRARVKGPLPALERKVAHAAWRVNLDAALERGVRAECAGDRDAELRAYQQSLTLLSSPDASGPTVIEQRLRVMGRLEALDAARSA
ncbi:MAG: hypothetical protein HYZ75_14900 [Elusimicrobia bacterium]|nr:hypothetical protein [Elusimicrobiota bacterium]